MARIPRPSVHGIERAVARLTGPYARSFCLELIFEGEGDESVRIDLWFACREYAEALCAALNSVPRPALEFAEAEG